MPELPDVAVFKKYLDSTSLHRAIEDIEITDDAVLEDVSSRTLRRKLQRRRLVSTRQHGKHLFVESDGAGWLVLHFGMTGYLKSFAREEKRPNHARILLHFADGRSLAYVSQRKLGTVSLAESPESVIEASSLGPDPLHSDFDLRVFRKLVRGRSGLIKSFLMNQEILAGVGNVYSDETLFEAGLHPAAPIEALDRDAVERLYRSMRKVLEKAIDRHADIERFPPGSLLRHRKEGEACPRCPGSIVRETVAGRSSYFCDRHQERPG